MINFYLGGARSGKSSRALQQALDLSAGGIPPVFVATAENTDAEFSQRIELHQQGRGSEWTTLEVPLDLVSQLDSIDRADQVILVDCLTVWLGNLMHHDRIVAQEVASLVSFLEVAEASYFLVSNEVGQGIVPDTSLGRSFRDEQGRLNQQIAAISNKVELLVAGIPLSVKG